MKKLLNCRAFSKSCKTPNSTLNCIFPAFVTVTEYQKYIVIIIGAQQKVVFCTYKKIICSVIVVVLSCCYCCRAGHWSI